MKLLLDQGLPRTTVKYLADVGITAVHVGELGMAAATDSEILDAARQDDADFHRLLAISRATTPSVVRIRIEGLNGHQLANILGDVINAASAELKLALLSRSRTRGFAYDLFPSAVRITEACRAY